MLDGGGAVILMSHLGRPKKNNDEKYSLRHIIPTIERLLGRPVIFAGDSMGEKAAELARGLKPGEVLLLENLRFYAEEEGKPRGLADDATDEREGRSQEGGQGQPEGVREDGWLRMPTCYINDAFGTAHRAHASTALIAEYFPNDKMFGYVMEGELKAIDKVLESAPASFPRPFWEGRRYPPRYTIIERLMERVDRLILGAAA